MVHGGSYADASLELGPEDSGLVVEAAAGENPVLLGGIRLTGWEPDGDRFVFVKLGRNAWRPVVVLNWPEDLARQAAGREGT